MAEGTLSHVIKTGAVAVFRAGDSDQLLRITEALQKGGVNSLEITMTTPGALERIRETQQRFSPDVVVGAGSVLDPETAHAAAAQGAAFVVSPCLNLAMIDQCHYDGVVAIPGTLTPTEMWTAWEAGADLVKVFPARGGGPRYIKDVLAPLPQLQLLPTGGVTLENAADFIRAGAVAVGVGSDLVDPHLVANEDFESLTDRASELLNTINEARAEN
ncbi:MAG: bifunctional 4-hydroxy-2-oxoglutarate aldolase/2-dehydro-3-deoxy-phosphogluconate aldolase [Salinibacter sp.]